MYLLLKFQISETSFKVTLKNTGIPFPRERYALLNTIDLQRSQLLEELIESPIKQYLNETTAQSYRDKPVIVPLQYDGYKMLEYDAPITDLEDVKDLLTAYLAKHEQVTSRQRASTEDAHRENIRLLEEQLKQARDDLAAGKSNNPFLPDFPDD